MSRGTVSPYKDFAWTRGLNNVDDAMSLRDSELQTADNVDIDDQGKPSRRLGPAEWLLGAYKWIWSNTEICLAVRETNLVRLLADKTEIVLRSDLVSGRRMVYKQVRNRVYYTNNQVIGYVEGAASYDLTAPADEFKRVMPPGEFLEYHGARLWVGSGNLLVFSDVGKLHQYDRRFNVKQFAGPLTLMSAVDDGVFIGDGSIRFMDLINPEEMKPRALKVVATYNAIPHMVARVEGGLVMRDKTFPGKVVFFGTEKGVCIGTDKGEFNNLTIQRYEMPAGKYGAAFYREKNHKGTSQVVMTITE